MAQSGIVPPPTVPGSIRPAYSPMAAGAMVATAASVAAAASMAVVIACGGRRRLKFTREQFSDRLVGRTLDPGEKRNSRGGKRALRARPDAAANDGIDPALDQPKAQGFVPDAFGFDNGGLGNPIVGNDIDLELGGLTKMRKDLPLGIGDGNSCIASYFHIFAIFVQNNRHKILLCVHFKYIFAQF